MTEGVVSHSALVDDGWIVQVKKRNRVWGLPASLKIKFPLAGRTGVGGATVPLFDLTRIKK